MKLKAICSQLVAGADKNRGEPQRKPLRDGLRIDIKIDRPGQSGDEGYTWLQLSRSTAPGPSDRELATVIDALPYVPGPFTTKRFPHKGRHYLTASWPTQPSLIPSGDSQ